MNIDVIENIMAYIFNIMLTYLSFKPYAKSISLSVRLPSPLRCASLTNEATPPMIVLDQIDYIVQSIPSSNQYCLRHTNVVHPTRDQLHENKIT